MVHRNAPRLLLTTGNRNIAEIWNGWSRDNHGPPEPCRAPNVASRYSGYELQS